MDTKFYNLIGYEQSCYALISTLAGLYNRTGHFSLVFTSDGVGAYDRVKMIIKKRGVIRATESDLEESKHFHYLPTPLLTI